MTPEILRPEQNLSVALGNRQMGSVYFLLPRPLRIPKTLRLLGAGFFGADEFLAVQITVEQAITEP